MTSIGDPEETRAMSMASMSLGFALAGTLKRMGVLEPEIVENAFEVALSSLENTFPPDDRSATLARHLLDQMSARLAAQVQPIGSERPGTESRARPSVERGSSRLQPGVSKGRRRRVA